MNCIDTEMDNENIGLPSIQVVDNDPSAESSDSNGKYRPNEIEKLLKLSVESKQYIVLRNSSSSMKFEVWNVFGFPAKQQNNGSYRSITGYVSCFLWYKTMLCESSTKYMNKHKCHVRDEKKCLREDWSNYIG